MKTKGTAAREGTAAAEREIHDSRRREIRMEHGEHMTEASDETARNAAVDQQSVNATERMRPLLGEKGIAERKLVRHKKYAFIPKCLWDNQNAISAEESSTVAAGNKVGVRKRRVPLLRTRMVEAKEAIARPVQQFDTKNEVGLAHATAGAEMGQEAEKETTLIQECENQSPCDHPSKMEEIRTTTQEACVQVVAVATDEVLSLQKVVVEQNARLGRIEHEIRRITTMAEMASSVARLVGVDMVRVANKVQRELARRS